MNMYVILFMVLGLLSPLPFVAPFGYDFAVNNDTADVKYGPIDFQREFNHRIGNSMINAYAQTANFTQITTIDIKPLKNNYTSGETIIALVTVNSSSSDTDMIYRITNPDGNFIDVGQINHMSNVSTNLSINTDDAYLWKQSGTYGIIIDYNGSQTSTSIMFNSSYQAFKPTVTVSTLKNNYTSGEKIIVTITTSSSTSAALVYTITDPYHNVTYFKYLGYVTNTTKIEVINTDSSKWDKSGTYTITVTHGGNHISALITYNASMFVRPTVDELITMRTIKNYYILGESVTTIISINSSSNHFPTLYDVAVTYKITNPTNQLIHVGQFIPISDMQNVINIKPSVDYLWAESGTYTIDAYYNGMNKSASIIFNASIHVFNASIHVSYPRFVNVSIPSGSSIQGCETNDTCFIPAHVNISTGGTVTWTNDDTAVHTVTSGSAFNGPGGEFDSSIISPGVKFSHTFTEIKTFDYFCIVHPWQSGTVIVKPANFSNNNLDNPTKTIGIATWGSSGYTAIENGLVRIIDPDLNTNNSIVENVSVDVWSDSDPGGITLNLIETRNDTGVFEGTVDFTINGRSNGHMLLVSFEDTITVRYYDHSLPLSYNNNSVLDILAVTTISTTNIPGPVMLEMTISSDNGNTEYAKRNDVLNVTLVTDRPLTEAKAQIFGRVVPVLIYNNTATFETNVTANDHGYAIFSMSVSNETEFGRGILAVTQNDLNSSNIFVDTLHPKLLILGKNPHIISNGENYTDSGAKVTDNDPRYNGTITTKNNVNTSAPGVYFVTYVADDDDAGNRGSSAERIVTVTESDGSAALTTSNHNKSFTLQHEKNIRVRVSNITNDNVLTLMSSHTILNNSDITDENAGIHTSKYPSDLGFIPNSRAFVEIKKDTIVRSNASHADHVSFVVREIEDPKYYLVIEIGNEHVRYEVGDHAIKIVFYNASIRDTPLFRNNSEGEISKILQYNGIVDNASHAFSILTANKNYNNSMYVWNPTESTYTLWFAHLSQAILDRASSSSKQTSSSGAPTLGKTGAGEQIVTNGFDYNGLGVNVGRYHTEFPLISTNVGDINSIKIKIYDGAGPQGVKRVEFALGVPDIGLYHDAEVIIEVWMEKDVLVVKDLIINDELNLLENSHISAEISQVSCSNGGPECLFVNLQYSYREAPLYNTMAVKPVDWDNQAYQFYFNDGIRVDGISQNDRPFIAISASHTTYHPVKTGNIYLIQTDRLQGLWVDEYGYKWSMQDNMLKQITFQEYQIPHDDRERVFHGPGRNNDGFDDILRQEYQRAFEKLPAYLRNE